MVSFGGVITVQLFDLDTISMIFLCFHFLALLLDPTVTVKNENTKKSLKQCPNQKVEGL